MIQGSRNLLFLQHLGKLRGSFTVKRFGRIWLNNGPFNNGRLDNGRTCVWNDADIYGLCIRFIYLTLTGGPLEGIGRICPDGYKLLDHIRDCRQGGGTALLFRDSPAVKKVGGGAKMSFEFSEWTVQLASSYGLRLVVVYRPHSDSDDHRIPMTTFFNDFTD